MREARSVMVALRQEVDLCFVLSSSEGLGVSYPVDVALKAGSYIALGLRLCSASRVLGSYAVLADERPLEYFAFFSRTRHAVASYQKCCKFLFITFIRRNFIVPFIFSQIFLEAY